MGEVVVESAFLLFVWWRISADARKIESLNQVVGWARDRAVRHHVLLMQTEHYIRKLAAVAAKAEMNGLSLAGPVDLTITDPIVRDNLYTLSRELAEFRTQQGPEA